MADRWWLPDRGLARAMGERGRDRVVQDWTWQRSGAVLRALLGASRAQQLALAAVPAIVWQEVVNRVSLTTPPKAKTISTISAAMPATSSPYSTADPFSSVGHGVAPWRWMG